MADGPVVAPLAVVPAATPGGAVPPIASPSAPAGNASMNSLIDASMTQAAAINGAPAVVAPAAPAPSQVQVNAPVPTAPAVVATAPTAPTALSPTDVVEDLSPQASGDKVHTYTVAKSQRLQAAAKFVKELTDIRPDLSLELFEKLNTQAQAVDHMYGLYMPIGQAITPEQVQTALANADSILQNVFIAHSPASFGTIALRAQAQLIKGAQSSDPAISVPMREAWNAVINWHRNNLKNDPQILANARSILIDELAAEIPQFQDLKARQTRLPDPASPEGNVRRGQDHARRRAHAVPATDTVC